MAAAPARRSSSSLSPWAGLPLGPAPLRNVGAFGLRVVGTFYYQEALHDLYGPRRPDGVKIADEGELVTEDENPFDPNAIALVVGGQLLGYLARENAILFRQAMADARIIAGRFPVHLLVTGGVSTSEGRLAQFLVHLDLHEPFILT